MLCHNRLGDSLTTLHSPIVLKKEKRKNSFQMLPVHLSIPIFPQGKVKRSYYFLPSRKPLEQEINRLKSRKRKNRQMDDYYVRDSQLSTHDDHTSENSHANEIPTPNVEEHSPNEEEHNKRQHKLENEYRTLLKLKLNEMADQRFLDYIYRKLLSHRVILCFISIFMN